MVEIAFDVIVRSNRHKSGFSLRFPRIVALRPDKSPDEIDTIETVTALYEGLQQGAEHLVTAGARIGPADGGLTFRAETRGRMVCPCSTPCQAAGPRWSLTLYTDSFVIKGSLDTRQRRITDMLNLADDPFLVLADVMFDEFGSVGQTVRADFAQVNLGSILFAVADTVAEPAPELRTPKIEQRAIVSIPPFKVTGHIHLLAERSLRDALTELTGNFLPVTEATYWSDSLGEARATAALVAINHRSPRSWPRTRRSTRGPASISSRPTGPAAQRPRPVGRRRHRSGPRTPPRPPVRHPHGPRSTRPGPRWIARPSPSDRPAGRAGCPTPPSRRRRPPRPRGRAA